MKKIASIAAGVIGVASFGLLFTYQKNFEERVSGGAPVPILVAAQDIPIGEVLRDDMIAVRQIPEAYLDNRHIRLADADKVVGIRVTMGLHSNESLLWTDLAASTTERRDLSGLVKPGMRAVTVKIHGGSALGGLLRPGDRIDLLLHAERDQEPVVMPLLQNVLVLSVGGDMGRANVIEAIQRSSDLTVSVTNAQAQALTLAQNEGQLSASLRNPDDIAVFEKAPVTTPEDIHLAERRAALQVRKKSVSKTPADKTQEIEHVR